MERMVLAYSGGLDASAIPWLAERYGAQIIAVTIDLGQGRELEAVRDHALATGALRAHVLDAREEFANRYLARALKADALYDDRRSMAEALGQPLTAQKLVEIAEIEQTAAVVHAGAGEERIGVAVRALNPLITVIAPGQPWGPAHTEAAGLSSAECPDEPACVELAFERGIPASINGIAMPLLDLIGSLDIIAGVHGVGRRGRLETPAALVLHIAHRELQAATSSEETRRFSHVVSRQYIDILDNGSWFSPLREALDAYVDTIHTQVDGVVRLTLFKGDCTIVDLRPATVTDTVRATPVKPLTFIGTVNPQ